MPKKRLKTNWTIQPDRADFKPTLTRYAHHLRDNGFRDSTVESYVSQLSRYLEFAGNEHPPIEKAQAFRDGLQAKRLARSTINNYCFAIKTFYKMLGQEVTFPYLQRNNNIPYYFTSDDVLRIFSVCGNLKHRAMLATMFYGCLRASELCHLDDLDVDLKSMTLRVREGKGGKDGIVIINEDCVRILREYLKVRPSLEIDGRQPLFYTDFGKRWDRRDVHRMFIGYKKAAGVEKQGGAHVFARHTPATILVSNGCDIRVIKDILRHQDIRTTLRYAHLSDKTKREMYEQYLKL